MCQESDALFCQYKFEFALAVIVTTAVYTDCLSLSSPGDEVLLERERHGGLARAGQPREPDGAAPEPGAEDLAALGAGHLVVLGEHVRGHLLQGEGK